MILEHLQTTFIIMLVKMVILPVVCALLMPLISKVIGLIMPPIINGLQVFLIRALGCTHTHTHNTHTHTHTLAWFF